MATTVTIDDEAKSRLEELRAEIRLRTGETVTRQELLTRLIHDAYESREVLIDSFSEATVPLSDGEIEALERGRISSGVETDEEGVDESLY